jgi:hypothetical protein
VLADSLGQIFYLFVALTANSGFDVALTYEPLVSRFGELICISLSSLLLTSRTPCIADQKIRIDSPTCTSSASYTQRRGVNIVIVIAVLIPDALVTVMISTPVQIFMAWRIRVLTGSTSVALIIIALALASAGTLLFRSRRFKP